jgi:phage baseplate assembly protein V
MSPDAIKAQIERHMRNQRHALRGKLTKLKASKRVQLAQIAGLSGEQFQDAEMFQHAGFRSLPLAGSQMIVIPLNGASAHGVVIASSNGSLHVANMEDGDTAIFNEAEGHFIHLKKGKIIRMEADVIELVATQKVLLDTPLVEATANMQAAGNVSDSAGKMAAMRSTFNAHKHGTSPAPTQQM